MSSERARTFLRCSSECLWSFTVEADGTAPNSKVEFSTKQSETLPFPAKDEASAAGEDQQYCLIESTPDDSERAFDSHGLKDELEADAVVDVSSE